MTASRNPENRPEKLQELQTEFAAHIRDPERQAPPPGIEDRRMKVYRELFFNNIRSLLASNFPVLRTLYNDEDWDRLVRDFYSEHRCRTPLFPEVAKEFLRYLQDSRKDRRGDPGFLLELAHYEWVELALSLDERELDVVAVDPGGDMLQGPPVLSPLAWPLTYRYPVHQIRPDYRPAIPPADQTHVLVYRNRRDEVKFMKLNDVSRLLLALISEDSTATGQQLLERVARTIGHPDPVRVVSTGSVLMEDLREKDILLGTRPI